MKLIIDIPEEQYNDIVKYLTDNDGNYAYSDFNLREIIRNGTPLPKGHGRLVDENPVIAQLVYRKNLLADNVTCGEVTKIFDSAVVVEADKENNNETDN